MSRPAVRPPDQVPPEPEPIDRTIWDRLADAIHRSPTRVLAIALVPLLMLLAALPTLETSHDTLATLPDDAESVQGFDALRRHMPAGETTPLVIVVDHDDTVLDGASLRALADLSTAVRRIPGVSSVRSVALPTDGRAPDLGDVDPQADIAALQVGLAEASEGAIEIAAGADELIAALDALDAGLGALADGLVEGEAGARDLRTGADAARAGLGEAREGVGQLRDGVAQLGVGLDEAGAGVRELRVEVAEPAEDAIRRAAEALDDFTVGRSDPKYIEAAEAVGEAHARITGDLPPYGPQAGQQLNPDYRGLAAALAELEGGLAEARTGVDALDAGLAELDAGLTELARGLDQLAGGLSELEGGLAEARGGVAELRAGVGELRAAVAGELAPGARELASGLAEGASDLDDADLDALEAFLPDDDELFVVTASLLDAQPEVREQLTLFLNGDESRTRLFVGIEDSPFSDAGIATAREVDRTAQRTLHGSPLQDATVLTTGSAAFISEVDRAASRDFPIIVLAVLVGVFVVLSVLLRSVVVPAYMVLTVLVTYGAALGATAVVFQWFLGRPGIQWWIPSMLFVMLVVLGVDYSIFLMSRVREEAERLVTRDAIAEGVRRTGQVITSAGLILAGTFAALLFAPLRSLAEFGFAAMVGILLDTFVVRALLVPSIATLLGRHNWWPSARARAA